MLLARPQAVRAQHRTDGSASRDRGRAGQSLGRSADVHDRRGHARGPAGGRRRVPVRESRQRSHRVDGGNRASAGRGPRSAENHHCSARDGGAQCGARLCTDFGPRAGRDRPCGMWHAVARRCHSQRGEGTIPVFIFAGTSPATQEGEARGSRNEFIHWIQDVFDQRGIVPAATCATTTRSVLART